MSNNEVQESVNDGAALWRDIRSYSNGGYTVYGATWKYDRLVVMKED